MLRDKPDFSANTMLRKPFFNCHQSVGFPDRSIDGGSIKRPD
jgi:hypothetical protein